AAEPALRSFAGRPVVPPDETVVRVLLYHGIGTRTSRPVVKTRAFREQLDWLAAQDIEVIRLSQLLEFLDGRLRLPRHAAVITIDDGELNGYSTAYPILKQRRLPFTLGIATQVIEEHLRRGALNWVQIREMIDSGLCEIASHSVTHRKMTLLPDEVARFELERSRTVLAEELALSPEAFFYPLGDHNYRIRRLTRQSGYRAAFVAHGGPTMLRTRRFGIPRYDVKPETSLRTFRSFFNHGIPVLRSSR
ncbi:MAG TPA: polysaccharide deacetylase family protein, partial [Polyangiaceae bacterium]|nr:polysaccharide deacetylase family protein [Polyangiaceae bacterium]